MSAAPADYLRSARAAVLGVFFANGVVIGTWVVRIPAIKDELGLGEGLLGVALLGAAVGALVAMPLVGALVSRFGPNGPRLSAFRLVVEGGILHDCYWTTWSLRHRRRPRRRC